MMSPIYLRSEGFSYGWYSNEAGEPPHVHMFEGRERSISAKFWLKAEDVELADNEAGFSERDLRKAAKFIEANKIDLLARWALFFGGD